VTLAIRRDFIGCVSANRRQATSIFSRYIGPEFSSSALPGSSTNKPLIPVYADSHISYDASGNPMGNCTTLDNVFSGQKPRITFNATRHDFVVAYEFVRAASATKGDIAAKKVNITLDGNHDVTVVGYMMPVIAANALREPPFITPIWPHSETWFWLSTMEIKLRFRNYPLRVAMATSGTSNNPPWEAPSRESRPIDRRRPDPTGGYPSLPCLILKVIR
jgi:hypothetical protein